MANGSDWTGNASSQGAKVPRKAKGCPKAKAAASPSIGNVKPSKQY